VLTFDLNSLEELVHHYKFFIKNMFHPLKFFVHINIKNLLHLLDTLNKNLLHLVELFIQANIKILLHLFEPLLMLDD